MSGASPSPSPPLLEACVTSLSEAVASVRGGAHRLELCVGLKTGGLTPPVPLLADVTAAVDVPVFCMVRPHPGPFVAHPGEVREMADEIAALREAGAAGLVLGLLDADGRVDADAVGWLREAAGDAPVTFHRAFDEIEDRPAALETLVDLGIARILTGGGPGAAWDGRGELKRLVDGADGRIGVLVAGHVRADHAAALVVETGATELHARAEAFPALAEALRAPGERRG